MAQIQPYTERVVAQGQMTGQARGEDFGAGLGEGISSLAAVLHDNEVKDDVTNAHVAIAKKRAEWQQKLIEMGNSTQLGDQTLAPRVIDGLQKDLSTLSGTVKTQQGQQALSRMTADMTAMFGQEAVGVQARLNGEFAKAQNHVLSQTLGTIAAQDHTQVESLIQQGRAAIDDPNGIYGYVTEAHRAELRTDMDNKIKLAAAQGFARRFPNAVLGSVPAEVRTVVQEAIATGANSGVGAGKGDAAPVQAGLPPNLKASLVKPYDQKLIDSRIKQVQAPSQFDQLFKNAAQTYNLDWRELKLRAAVESSLNPSADNGQSKGLMQFTPATAAKYGIDPMKPQEAIFAAAKMIADYRTKANGDMSKVDMMYYGGESGKGWGPNTQQYAANMASLRQASGLGSAVAPEAFAPTPAQVVSETQRGVKPATGIAFIDSLPADKFFSILTEAEHYQRAVDSASERARIAAEHQVKKAQNVVMDGMLKRVTEPNQANGGVLNETEIVNNPTLTWEQKQHMIDYSMRRTKELAANSEHKSNPEEVRRLELLIQASREDPSKTFNKDPIMESYKQAKISTAEMRLLKRDFEDADGFRTKMRSANNLVETGFMRSARGAAQPAAAADAVYRFRVDLDDAVEKYRKENKDPSVLLTPGRAEYMLDPAKLNGYWKSSASRTLNDEANKVREGGATPPAAEFVVGKSYKINGKDMKYLGGPTNVRTSWQ